MRYLLISTLFLINLNVFSQSGLRLFKGNLDQAFDSAKILNKDVLLIVGSDYCGYYVDFTKYVMSDSNIVSLFNSQFITYLFMADDADKAQKKRFKKYNRSWPGWPQFYFLDSNEKMIANLSYPKYTSNQEFIDLLKSYKVIEHEWNLTKKQSKKGHQSLEQLSRYIKLRDMNYSSFGDIQINKHIAKYFKDSNPEDYSLKKNWVLFKRYVRIQHDLGSDKELFESVVNHRTAFQKENEDEQVSNYLYENFRSDLNWRKEEEVDKMAKMYPYNTVPEAIKAIQSYKESKSLNTIFKKLEI